MRYADAATDRRDVNNMSAASLFHMWQYGQSQICRCQEHYFHRLLEIGVLQTLQWRNADVARVVDENIDSPEAVQHACDKRLYFRFFTDVAREYRSVNASFGEPGPRVF